MPLPFATKASDKQQACKKLTSLLHKDYGKSDPKFSYPVLETMLFAACVEDNSWDAAEQGYDRLNKLYYDLNEVRVSSVAEIEETLCSMRHGDWAALRIRSILRYVFESTYTYDYEKLKKLTQDSAQKRLKKIDNMTPFIRNFTVQHSLAGYLVCLDTLCTRAAIHLGIVPPGSTEEQAGEFLKPGLRKAETFGFTCALRCLATDPRFIERLSEPPEEEAEFNVRLVETRFNDLKKPKKKKKKPAVPPKKAKSTANQKAAADKTTATKKHGTSSSAKSPATGKAEPKTPAARRTAAKSPAARSTAAKKATTGKSVVKKAKTTKKKSTAKKTATTAKKSTAKKTATTAKKSTAKKTATTAKKSTAKKTATTAKKSTAKKTATTAKKSTAKKTPAKKAISKSAFAKKKPVKKKASGKRK